MPPLNAIIQGHFTPRALRVYLAVLACIFWPTIVLCWSRYPVEHEFSILTHTFSFLGSFNANRNPGGWWLFCIAVTTWGLASFPLAFYFHHHARATGPKRSSAPQALMLLGCYGILCVGLFPDARAGIIGGLRWTDLHYLGAVFIVLGFVIGIPWLGFQLRRAARDPRLDDATRRAYRRAWWPHVFFMVVSSIALFFLIRWELIYPALKAAAEAEGREFGSRWREAMNSIYSFPLWDNLFVYTLWIYFVWTALALPSRIPEEGT